MKLGSTLTKVTGLFTVLIVVLAAVLYYLEDPDPVPFTR